MNHGQPSTPAKPIIMNTLTKKIEVDNQISLGNYFGIADNLLKQADVFRKEKNIVDLYIMLIRFSSLLSETIPFHRDYQALKSEKKRHYKKKLLDVLEELENLKPEFQRRVNELNKAHTEAQQKQIDAREKTLDGGSETSMACPSANAPSLENKPVFCDELFSSHDS